MTRADALRLGPFVGGINTGSDPTAVADSELVDCVNFELDIDGSLVQRPPIVATTDRATGANNLTIIGNAIVDGTSYLVGSDATGTYIFDGTSWSTILANLESKIALQYRNNIYVVATEASSVDGGFFNPTTSTWTSDASMPRGESAIFSKTRMFVVPGVNATVNTSRLTFTDPITSDTLSWPASNIIDVSPGDGENLVDLLVYNDNLLLFKQDSTYVLAYDLQPSDAILRNINPTIGATTRFCVIQYENSVFIYHEGKVYEVVNYDFQQVNIKVPFTFDGTTPAGTTRAIPVFLSLLGDRLLVRYYNYIYMYGLKTKTWTRWESADDSLHNFGPLMEYPSNPTQAVNTKYYAGSSLAEDRTVVFIPNGWDSITKENNGAADVVITSYILTKNYDLADSHHFKKMMWWGADIVTNQDVIGYATPVATNFQVTWLDLSTKLWADLTGALWAYPLATPSTVETDVTITTKATRSFLKFKKTMRFRQINYKLVLKGDGSTLTGPCRVFTLTAIIGSKETVSKQVS